MFPFLLTGRIDDWTGGQVGGRTTDCFSYWNFWNCNWCSYSCRLTDSWSQSSCCSQSWSGHYTDGIIWDKLQQGLECTPVYQSKSIQYLLVCCPMTYIAILLPFATPGTSPAIDYGYCNRRQVTEVWSHQSMCWRTHWQGWETKWMMVYHLE